MKTLLQKSKDYKKKADLLLKSSKLIEFLKQYGSVEITGSYSYNLMISGDIDIEIINPKINRDKVIEILNQLIKQGYFYGFMFGNWIDFQKKNFPKGYYIGLKSKKYHTKWKIDLWFLKTGNINEVKKIRNLIINKLNKYNKPIILELKDFRNKKYSKLESVIIYKAVLIDKITNTKDFIKYIEK